MNKWTLTIFSVLIFKCSVGQVSEINGLIKEVQLSESIYQQNIQQLDIDGLYKISVTQISKKGKQSKSEFIFNPNDINLGSIQYSPKREYLSIGIETLDRQDFVKCMQNAKFQKYDNKLELVLRDIDDAKRVIELFKNLCEKSRKSEVSNLPPDDFDGIRNWLVKNIKGYSTEKESVDYSISFDPKSPIECTITTRAKRIDTFRFNLGDLSNSLVSLRNRGELFTLTFGVNDNQKYIAVSEDGEKKNNVNEYSISTHDLELMKGLRLAFEKLIPIAKEKQDSSKPDVSDFKNAINYISLSQKLDIDFNCNAKILGYEDLDSQKFNFSDLDPHKISEKVKGSTYSLELETKGGERLITETEKDNSSSFTNSTYLRTDNLESFRQLKPAVEAVIKSCQNTYNINIDKSLSIEEKIKWLNQNIPSIESSDGRISQHLNGGFKEPCKMKYSIEEVGKKATKKQEYELKPYLFDSYLSQLKISAKNVTLELVTIDKEKIIETSINGKPENLTSQVEIKIDDIEKGKMIYEMFRSLIVQCK